MADFSERKVRLMDETKFRISSLSSKVEQMRELSDKIRDAKTEKELDSIESKLKKYRQ
jgi:hypothetical protein